ncbi:MAG: hypothetical protein B6243_01430 [Anaerolineaceae bacterium 4572_5.2]|nr:MAG: hypothetical protein B6243_01430 [Anaerolineaceae bacterium 4572_5.2]
MAYPAIIEATNAKAAADDSFAVIDNPDVIEVGQKLWIPAADAEAVGMANPASVYCGEQGGALDIRAADDGSQTGYCVFADGSECEEWAFMRGECSPASAATAEVTAAAEVEVTDIVLTGLLEDRKAEISGMDWYGDNLIMLPQYPTYFTDAEEGYAFALSKDDIMAFLDGAVASLAPTQISFIAPGVKDKAAGFQGYEAIAFVGNIEYRLTDATKLDGDNRFWAINYFYPGDEDLTPASDPIVETYGEGETHSANDGVERLLQFQYADSGISLTDAAPIQLKLLEEDLRNWEGLVRLGDSGFLLMTDKYPGTILGFVPAAK